MKSWGKLAIATVAVGGLLLFVGCMTLVGSIFVIGATTDPGTTTSSADGVETTSPTTAEQTSAPTIEGPPDELLPTIDDFDSGWARDDVDQANETAFFKQDTGTHVSFAVQLHDKPEAAKAELEARRADVRERGLATEEASVGDEGIRYEEGPDFITVEFRVQNIVAKMAYFTESEPFPDREADQLVALFEDSIRS
jgi:hypothetical protein